MKTFTCATKTQTVQNRRGSTLVIVIALLGLLMFTGMVFYTFSSQERAAAEYFSEAAKVEVNEVEDPFPWGLQQLLLGATNDQKGSILWSPTQRYSLVRNMIGPDIAPYTGQGFHVVYDQTTRLPVIDNDHNGNGDAGGGATLTLAERMNFVDAVAAWGGAAYGLGATVESSVVQSRGVGSATPMPEPDVDYTYPDVNNLFLGYYGWSIRDRGTDEDLDNDGVLDPGEDTNGNGMLDRRYEQVRTIIPSFFRPQYLKSSTNQGANGVDVPTDPDWYLDSAHPEFGVRSFRPHAQHVSGFDSAGNAVLRYLDSTNPAHAAAIAALPGSSGAFPLRRSEGNTYHNNSVNFGKLGVWTGHGSATADTFELDSDNDGGGIREGIWLDLRYPLQETSDGRLYVVLHSFTIHDLDALLDLNVHGNIAGLPRDQTIPGVAGGGGLLATTFLSQSNHGIGPHEVNPLFALAPKTNSIDTNPAFNSWFGVQPTSRLEQANMELLFLLSGRIDEAGSAPVVLDGRWGDASALWYHRFTGGGRRVNSLPRPGRAGNLATNSSDPFYSFGGKAGNDDNQDTFEGMAYQKTGRVRGVVHPIDYSGRGSRTLASDFRRPDFVKPSTTPERWPRYTDYPLVGTTAGVLDNQTYLGGQDGDLSTSGDNLFQFSNAANPNFNALFEDPYETIVDQDRAIRPDDQIFGIQDLIIAHLTGTDAGSAEGLSTRLQDLAPVTFNVLERSRMFTTLSSSFRHFALMHDSSTRPWEWNADVDGDGQRREFPPTFFDGSGTEVLAFSANDPFRPQVRRMLLTEAGEGRAIYHQLPLSVNHILDVNRSAQTPLEGSAQFVNYMQRSGIRFRPLTEHPLATETDSGGTTARESVTTIPTVVAGSSLPVYPPQNLSDREFWARRDRQQLARDIYVLLYLLGGAQVSGTQVVDYTRDNSARALYSEAKLRQMAQFAVNMVDAMDADNVITKFEYDKNLGDGWNLDDDPYTFSTTSDPASLAATSATNVTLNGMYPDDANDRGVVYGVEAQELAFSEYLAVRSRNLASDHDATHFDDSHAGDPTAENDFLFIELQNPLPKSLALGSGLATETVGNAVWRIVRQDRINTSDDIQTPREVTAATPPDHFIAFATDAAGRNEVEGGGRFSISATNAVGARVVSSDLFVDVGQFDSGSNAYIGDFDGTYELIAPHSTSGTLPATSTPTTDPAWLPRCDLDLIAHATGGVFQGASAFLNSVQPYAGHEANGPLRDANLKLEGGFDQSVESSMTNASFAGFDLVLQRRLNTDLPSISDETENPWVEVDRMRVMFADLNIDEMDIAADIRSDSGNDRLKNVKSIERGEALRDRRDPHAVIANTQYAFRSNSIKGDTSTPPDDFLGDNSNTNAAGFQIWQPHYDREFVSLADLFIVPAFGPQMLTQRLSDSQFPAYQQLGAGSPDFRNAASAASLFLYPDLTPDTGDAVQAGDNRWYRLLQFLEVPSRVNRMIGNYVSLKSIPGKLNLNTVRDREVYGGLIDETQALDLRPLSDANANGDDDGPFSFGSGVDGIDGIPSTLGGRDRWLELINERDGNVTTVFDPTPALPNSGDELSYNHWIPGVPNSRPFRSLAFRQPVSNGGALDDNGLDETLLRRLSRDVAPGGSSKGVRNNFTGEGSGVLISDTNAPDTNRHWVEVGNRAFHQSNTGALDASLTEHHQLLSKMINNTTTVSNTFIVYGTVGYFEARQDPVSGLIQVGGRMGLDTDGDSDPTNDPGWEQRAVFVIDRTELFEAYDGGSGSIDWERLIKHRTNLASDGK